MNIIKKGTYKWINTLNFTSNAVIYSETPVIKSNGKFFNKISMECKRITSSPEYKREIYYQNTVTNEVIKIMYYGMENNHDKYFWTDEAYKTFEILQNIEVAGNTPYQIFTNYITEQILQTLKTLKVNGKVLSKVNDKYLKNLNDSPIFAAKKAEAVSAGETWLINENPVVKNYYIETEITGLMNVLTDNNTYGELKTFQKFSITYNSVFIMNTTDGCNIRYQNNTWTSYNQTQYTTANTTKLRTITFDTAPTGELLTWLQANAVKQ